MTTHTNNRGSTSEASLPQPARPEVRKSRHIQWGDVPKLPGITSTIHDDIFWAAHHYRKVKPETAEFLARNGICGVLWA